MIVVDRGISSTFAVPLMDVATIVNRGYLFKIVHRFNDTPATYLVPTKVSESLRFTTFTHTFNLASGAYSYYIFEYDTTQPTPTDETGLNELANGILKIKETSNIDGNIYL